MTKTLVIRQLARFPKNDASDELNFELGVNVIVGAPNTGKTQWLRMFDYLMGDAAPTEQAFAIELVNKYDSIKATLEIGDEEIILERRWKEPGLRSKVIVDGTPINATDLSAFLLLKLDMPILDFQSGGLMSARGWVALSWRVLLRHIYRKSSSWSEIANKQPPQEQHACLLMFTGIGDVLFSPERQLLAEKQRKRLSVLAEKDQFMDMLQRIAKDLFVEGEISMGLTPDLIQKTILRLQEAAKSIDERRSERLQALQEEIDQKEVSKIEELKTRWAEIQATSEEMLLKIKRAQNRLLELSEYQTTVHAESDKLERATSAARVFDDLRITHCPVCHKPVKPNRYAPDLCFMCGQPDQVPEYEEAASQRRLEFEREQLKAERIEADELVEKAKKNLKTLSAQKSTLDELGRQINATLHPIRQAVSALRDPDISLFEREYGALQERINQLIRVQLSLRARGDFNEEIQQLEVEISKLEATMSRMENQTDRNTVSDILTDSLIEYLSEIKRLNPASWTLNADIKFRVFQNSFALTINGQSWEAKLGETLKFYFLLAYNYALLRLSNRNWAHYPGFTIFDLPLKLSDGSTVSDKENFVLEPFINLTKRPDMPKMQVICTGSAFENLAGVNRIILGSVWE